MSHCLSLGLEALDCFCELSPVRGKGLETQSWVRVQGPQTSTEPGSELPMASPRSLLAPSLTLSAPNTPCILINTRPLGIQNHWPTCKKKH